jgi:hypothetical protein
METVVIDLDAQSTDKISINAPKSPKVSPKVLETLGEGVELLMNDKRKMVGENKDKSREIKNISSLEDELNNLSTSSAVPLKRSDAMRLSIGKSMGATVGGEDKTSQVKKVSTTAVGKQTAEIKIDKGPLMGLLNVPVDPDKKVPEHSREQMLKEKFSLLRKFDSLSRRGVELTKKYNMDSNLDEMKGEYEMIVSEKEKNNSVQFQGKMLMAAITGLEFLNNKFDPFDVQLDGWAEQMNENIVDYDEIFGELHEKYKTKAKMAPELKLLFQLSGSAIMVHMTNTMFKSAMPGMDDIMRQNPELMQQFTKAAVNTMSEDKPGFSSFMGDIMGGNDKSAETTPSSDTIHGPPPAAMKTRVSERDIPSTRPDINAARSDFRPDMKGPTDISALLQGLKKKIPQPETVVKIDDSSTVSIKDLKEMADARLPTRSKLGTRSKKSTISLDI